LQNHDPRVQLRVPGKPNGTGHYVRIDSGVRFTSRRPVFLPQLRAGLFIFRLARREFPEQFHYERSESIGRGTAPGTAPVRLNAARLHF